MLHLSAHARFNLDSDLHPSSYHIISMINTKYKRERCTDVGVKELHLSLSGLPLPSPHHQSLFPQHSNQVPSTTELRIRRIRATHTATTRPEKGRREEEKIAHATP
jgi:hypothetical protein